MEKRNFMLQSMLFGGGSGGSSGGGALIAHVTANGSVWTIDKTYSEIYAAAEIGQVLLIMNNDGEIIHMHFCYIDPVSYTVEFGVSDTTYSFKSDSPDGYPYANIS